MADKEKDALTGIETTGHEWDGLKELNSPLPKWWLWTFYATVIWGIGYFIVYPSWPTGLGDYTKGVFGYSSRAELSKQMEMVRESRSGWLARFEESSVKDIAGDSELLQFAMAGGRAIFADNCAPCHGTGGAGAPEYPVLADDDWIWGGTLEAIEASIRYGIRADHDETRVSEMPKYGADELLTPAQIDAAADYVLALAGGSGSAEGKTVFEEECVACHGDDGKGLAELGGPNLADGIWLYGGSKEAVAAQITNPSHGVMPAWVGRLGDVEIKQVSVYVHSLGGGQ